MSSIPQIGQSPPNRDPGPKQLGGGPQAPLSQEIHKLQNELEVYIQKIEELANRGNSQNQLVTLGPCLTLDYTFEDAVQQDKVVKMLLVSTIPS